MTKLKNLSSGKEDTGFTKRVALAIVYTAVILQPVVLYIMMAANITMIGFVGYITALLATEIASIYGKPLTKQETFIIIAASGLASGGFATQLFFLSALYGVYFRSSPITKAFGISENIPFWSTPPESVLVTRTFLDPSWTIPLLLSLLFMCLTLLGGLGLDLFFYRLYAKEENLPFPRSEIGAAAAMTLSERDPMRMIVFTISALITMIYGIPLYAVPIITGAALNVSVKPIPIPWVDLNYVVETYVPGMSFGIATDVLAYAIAFILPFNVDISIFIGSMALYMIGNPIMLSQGLWPGWLPGLSLQDSLTNSMLYIWASPSIGLSLAVGLLPLIVRPRLTIRSFKSITRIKWKSEEEEISPLLQFPLFLVCGLVASVLSHMLVPSFPIWIFLLLSLGYSFVLFLVYNRAIAETGTPMNLPYVQQGMFLASGYQSMDVWFVPGFMVSAPVFPPGWLHNFKTAELTNTKISSLIKASALAIALGFVMNFVYTSALWEMAPIPSSMYPALNIYWPLQASQQILWISGAYEVFRPIWIASGFLIASIVFFIVHFTHIPLSLIGLAVGANAPIPNGIAFLIGGLLSRILRRYFGSEWWDRYKVIIVAGLGAGTALIAGLATGIAVTLKAMHALPF